MTCYLTELAFDEWGETLLAPLNGGRYPLTGSIELTDRCNMGCKHCYINQAAGDSVIRKRELSTSQIKDIFNQIAEAGCMQLLMTGGEPLLRPDFTELYLYARSIGLMIVLFTNATMITPEIIEVLKSSPPLMVEVSIYGVTKETYEKVTGLPGSFERFLNGMTLLKESGLKAATKSVLLNINMHELAKMKEFAQEMGMPFRYDGSMWPRVNGASTPFDYQLTVEDNIKLDNDDPERLKNWTNFYLKSKDKIFRNEKYAFNCGAGHRSFHIDSQGRIGVCMMVRRPSFSVPELGFSNAWLRLDEVRHAERTKGSKCLSCSAASMCVQCPGWSQLMYNDNETIVDSVCQLTKAREKNILSKVNLVEEIISNG